MTAIGDFIKAKMAPLDTMNPKHFNDNRFNMANLGLGLSLVGMWYFNKWGLLIMVIPAYSYTIYTCMDWAAIEKDFIRK